MDFGTEKTSIANQNNTILLKRVLKTLYGFRKKAQDKTQLYNYNFNENCPGTLSMNFEKKNKQKESSNV